MCDAPALSRCAGCAASCLACVLLFTEKNCAGQAEACQGRASAACFRGCRRRKQGQLNALAHRPWRSAPRQCWQSGVATTSSTHSYTHTEHASTRVRVCCLLAIQLRIACCLPHTHARAHTRERAASFFGSRTHARTSFSRGGNSSHRRMWGMTVRFQLSTSSTTYLTHKSARAWLFSTGHPAAGAHRAHDRRTRRK